MQNYTYSKENDCCLIKIGNNDILIDNDKYELLENSNKIKVKTWKLNENEMLYTVNTNNKPVYFLELLFNLPFDAYKWTFKNNNKFDLRIKNINCEFKLPNNIKMPDNLKILNEFPGHYPTLGKTAGKLYNPYWLVEDKNLDQNPFYVMFCEPGIFAYFSKESLEKIIYYDKTNQVPTWFKMDNGYVAANLDKQYYIHQIIMNYYDHGSHQLSIDHINRNKLDNRLSNLRIATQSEQNKNTDKRSRKYNAKALPEGLKQSDLPKFVVYIKETVNKSTGATREFFMIDSHPKLNGKRWVSSKSNKIPIKEKLEATKKQLNEINK